MIIKLLPFHSAISLPSLAKRFRPNGKFDSLIKFMKNAKCVENIGKTTPKRGIQKSIHNYSDPKLILKECFLEKINKFACRMND